MPDPKQRAQLRKRLSDKVDEEIKEVVESAPEDSLVRLLAKATGGLNEVLAVHALWVEERHDDVDERLVSIARMLARILAELQLIHNASGLPEAPDQTIEPTVTRDPVGPPGLCGSC